VPFPVKADFFGLTALYTLREQERFGGKHLFLVIFHSKHTQEEYLWCEMASDGSSGLAGRSSLRDTLAFQVLAGLRMEKH
jgi:hypothetical protein